MSDPAITFPESVRQALDEAKEELEEMYGDRLRKLVVYGSQARGEAGPESDVDLMIVLEGDVDVAAEAEQTSGLVVRIAAARGVAISPLHLSEQDFWSDRPVSRAARREGISL